MRVKVCFKFKVPKAIYTMGAVPQSRDRFVSFNFFSCLGNDFGLIKREVQKQQDPKVLSDFSGYVDTLENIHNEVTTSSLISVLEDDGEVEHIQVVSEFTYFDNKFSPEKVVDLEFFNSSSTACALTKELSQKHCDGFLKNSLDTYFTLVSKAISDARTSVEIQVSH